MSVTLGADPEIFFQRGGVPASAIDLIGGSKEVPLALGEDFFILEDNVAAEFNVPPSNTIYKWDEVLKKGIKHVEGFAEKAGMGLSHAASAHFAKNELRHPKAREFGCDPDYNAWSLGMNPRPKAKSSTFRTAGGHIHVGGIEELDGIQVIRAMDLFLGVPSVVLDTDTERRQLYGKAGAFRNKPYGVEYRTLSNFWIFDEKLRAWAWEATIAATEFVRDGNRLEPETEVGDLIVATINDSNREGYELLCKLYPNIASK